MDNSKQELLEIYTDDTGAFTVGRIIARGGSDAAVEGVDEQGRPCGYFVMPADKILGTQSGTPYLAKIRRYIEFWETQPGKDGYSLPPFPEGQEGPLMSRVIRAAMESGELLSAGIAGEDVPAVGYVRSFSRGKIRMETVDPETAAPCGEQVLRIKDIDYIEYGSIDNRLLKYACEADARTGSPV